MSDYYGWRCVLSAQKISKREADGEEGFGVVDNGVKRKCECDHFRKMGCDVFNNILSFIDGG